MALEGKKAAEELLARIRARIKERPQEGVGDEKDASQEAAPPPEPLNRAADYMDAGGRLSGALGDVVGEEGGEDLAAAQDGLDELKTATSGLSDAERKNLQGIVRGEADQPISGEVEKALTIIATIQQAANSVTAPDRLKRYSKLMALRPLGEVGVFVAEAGLMSLIATGILNAVGIPVPYGSALHIATYILSAGGIGTANIVTKADFILRALAEGSPRSLVKSAPHAKVSAIRVAASAGRILLLTSSVAAGIGVTQYTIGTTHTSTKVAGGLADPLQAFSTKMGVFEGSLRGFSKIPGKILEIAEKIETGKQPTGTLTMPTFSLPPEGETPKQKRAREKKEKATIALAQKAAGEVTAWTAEEKVAMLDELRSLFKEANLDPTLVDKLQFAEPEKLGFGPAAKFKRAIRTGAEADLIALVELRSEDRQKLAPIFGDLPTTRDYVLAIRKKMDLKEGQSFDSKVGELVGKFLSSQTLRVVEDDLSAARSIESMIRTQGEDVLATAERAFLHGAAPIGPEAMMPMIEAILTSREKIDKESQVHLTKPIDDMFAVLGDALSSVGASVTLQKPAVVFDTSDMQRLSDYISSLADEGAKSNQVAQRTHSAVQGLIDTFVPGGKKWEDTKRYIAVLLLRDAGYFVRLEGNKTVIYEPLEAVSDTGHSSGENTTLLRRVSRYIDEWLAYFAGEELQKPEVMKIPVDELRKMSDEELGRRVRPDLPELAEGRKILEISSLPRPEGKPRAFTDEEIGKAAREQLDVLERLGKPPFILSPEVWQQIKEGAPPPGMESFDTSKWKVLSEEASKELLGSYDRAAAWRGIAYIGGGVSGVVLGVLLLSLFPVWNLNRKLRAAAPDFEKDVREAEKGIIDALDALNNIFAGIPVLRDLPRMDFTLLHAALRKCGEELFPAELAEAMTLGQKIARIAKESLARGPYAHSVEEIMSMTFLIEKLQTSKRMQKKLADIIAAGCTQAEDMARSLTDLPERTGNMAADIHAQLGAMPLEAQEVFRDSARGALRFRVNVRKAELDAFSVIQEEAGGRDNNQDILEKIKQEVDRIQNELGECVPLLERLDRLGMNERVKASYKAPGRLSSRAGEQARADLDFTIEIPRDGIANKDFSVPSGILEMCRARVGA